MTREGNFNQEMASVYFVSESCHPVLCFGQYLSFHLYVYPNTCHFYSSNSPHTLPSVNGLFL